MAVLNCLSGSGMARRSGRNSPFHGFAQTHALCGASAHHNQTGKKQIKTKRGRHGSPLLRIRPTQRSSCGVSQKNGKVRWETPILQGRKRQRREGAIKLLETGWPSHPASQYTAAPWRCKTDSDSSRLELLFPRLNCSESKLWSCEQGPNLRVTKAVVSKGYRLR